MTLHGLRLLPLGPLEGYWIYVHACYLSVTLFNYVYDLEFHKTLSDEQMLEKVDYKLRIVVFNMYKFRECFKQRIECFINVHFTYAANKFASEWQ